MGRKKKEKYFLISEEGSVFAFSINWDRLPAQVIESCNSKQIYETVVYTKGSGFKNTSVLYFIELDPASVEDILKDEERKLIEDTKGEVKFII